MANLVDLYLVYRILRLFTTPFSQWEGFKTGVIDATGNIIIPLEKRTLAQQDSFTKFDLLVSKLKKVLEKLPFGKTRLASYAAALFLLKEEKNLTEDMSDEMLVEKFDRFCKTDEMLNEAKVDKHEMGGYVVIDGYVFKDSGKQGRSTYGRYTIKDPNYVKDPKEVGMHRNYRKPDFLSFSTMAELKKWLKTQPKKSAADIEAIHKKYAEREQMYTEEVAANATGAGVVGTGSDQLHSKPAVKAFIRRFANNDVFVVSSDTFKKARLGKKKFVKYEKYVGNDDIGNTIREYGRKYPKRPIILQNEKDGSMIFLRYGRTGMFTESFEPIVEEITQADLKSISVRRILC